MKTSWRACAVLVAALVATGCPPAPPVGPTSGPVPVAPPGPPPAAKAPPAAPAVVRAPIVPLPLEAPVERGKKPEGLLMDVAPLLEKGKKLYEMHCLVCHGKEGAGDGPAAFACRPRPRNFTKGWFKLHTNENGSLPTEEDLFDTLTLGMGGVAMPTFSALTAEDRWALIAVVETLSVTLVEDPNGIDVPFYFFKERPPKPSIPVGTVRPATPALVDLGKATFMKLECNKCHGNDGDGNGQSAANLKDDWGEDIWPRNFQDGHFRGVFCLKDVTVRVNTGVSGTPMAAFGGGQVTDEQRWGLAHFVASLRKGDPKPQPPQDGFLVATRCPLPQPVPTDLRQPRFWIDVPSYDVPLAGDGPKAARVAVQRDAGSLAVVVAWDDPIAKERPAAPEDFLDAVTLTLSGGGTQNAWEWRGEWQKDEARTEGPFEERGAGSLSLKGFARWAQGEWRVLFVRPLAGDAKRVNLEGKVVALTLEVHDRSPAGTRTSKSATLQLSVP